MTDKGTARPYTGTMADSEAQALRRVPQQAEAGPEQMKSEAAQAEPGGAAAASSEPSRRTSGITPFFAG